MKTHKPLLGTEYIVNFNDIFGDTCVVQDNPERWDSKPGQPVPKHESRSSAENKGFLFGVLTDNNGKCWTRNIYFKPSQNVLDKWNSLLGRSGSGDINSLTVDPNRRGETKRPVYASYMNGIGRKLIGYISEEVYAEMKKQAWEVELGQPILIQ